MLSQEASQLSLQTLSLVCSSLDPIGGPFLLREEVSDTRLLLQENLSRVGSCCNP
jgi:hypothetical protein